MAIEVRIQEILLMVCLIVNNQNTEALPREKLVDHSQLQSFSLSVWGSSD